ncbi:unnamed protein product [Polarella glacialis]|uniref:Uncharacterized protein n=1 Tax=Polarella glacialis TaxID=89957 RepID=A0A813D5M7_POLGL|nr:unnamed protein product [Polarella glacialis]
MHEACMRNFSGSGQQAASCILRAAELQVPYVNLTHIYGAAIFCSHAAMVRLSPYLPEVLVTGFMRDWESGEIPADGNEPACDIGNTFRDYLPVSDILLGICTQQLFVRQVDFTPMGYFGGNNLPGTLALQKDQTDKTLPENVPFYFANARCPAIWHKLSTELDFEAVHYWHQ